MILILYSLVAGALFYLGSRAQITAPLWSRYPHPLAKLMDCPACIGFWWGLILAMVGDVAYDVRIFDLPRTPLTGLLTGLCLIITTPIVAALQTVSLLHVGHAVTDEEQPEPEDLNNE